MPQAVLSRHHVQQVGCGKRPLILAHGFGCDQTIWRRVVPLLSDDFRIVLFDHVGHGRCDPRAHDPERHATLDGYAGDVCRILDAAGVRDAVFVGHSISSMIGLLAAQQCPAYFASMVMLAPSPCFENHPQDGYVGGFERQQLDQLLALMESNYQSWSIAMASAAAGAGQAEVGDEMQRRLLAQDPAILCRFARAVFLLDLRARLPGFTLPTLLVQCMRDALVPLAVGDYLLRTLPDARLEMLDADGHLPQLSHPHETAALIREFAG